MHSKSPKQPTFDLMERVIVRIVARHDSSDDFLPRAREKQRGVAVLEKRDVSSGREILSVR